MAFVIGLVGCITMGVYSISSLLFTRQINSLTAFYVSADTAFILGGGLAVIAALLCYSNIYKYFECHICSNEQGPLSRISVDTTKHSNISIETNHLLQEDEEFECPICKDSMLISQSETSAGLQPITLRYISNDRPHDEQTYHKSCISGWIDSGGQREPVLGVDLFQPAKGRVVLYNGFNKRQRDLCRKLEKSQLIDSSAAQFNTQH